MAVLPRGHKQNVGQLTLVAVWPQPHIFSENKTLRLHGQAAMIEVDRNIFCGYAARTLKLQNRHSPFNLAKACFDISLSGWAFCLPFLLHLEIQELSIFLDFFGEKL